MKIRTIWVESPWKISCKETDFNEEIRNEYDLIVKTHFSHLSSGTELACVSGIEDWFPLPNIPGYTAVGEVLQKGSAVDHVNVGDMVYTFGPHSEIFKVNLTDRFHGVCVKVAEGLDPDVAAFTHMGGIAISSLRTSSIELGDTVAVSGMGTIGNFAAQFAQLQGANVLVSDINNKRLKIAKDCGLEKQVNTNERDLAAAIEDAFGSRTVKTWIDATGLADVINSVINYIDNNGELILLGSPRAAFKTDITRLLQKVHLMENVSMKGALEFIFPTHQNDFNKHSIERNSLIIMNLLKENKLKLGSLYSHKLKPEEASAAYLGLRDHPEKYVGVIFDWN